MPIATTCPGCDTRYNLPDSKAGKRVRCRACGETILVREEEEDRGASRRSKRPAGRDDRVQAARTTRAVARSRRDRDEDEEDDEEDERPRKKKGSSLPIILAGVAVGLVVLCGGGGFGIRYLVLRARRAAAEATVAKWNNAVQDMEKDAQKRAEEERKRQLAAINAGVAKDFEKETQRLAEEMKKAAEEAKRKEIAKAPTEGPRPDVRKGPPKDFPKDFPKDIVKVFPKDFPKDVFKDLPKTFPKDFPVVPPKVDEKPKEPAPPPPPVPAGPRSVDDALVFLRDTGNAARQRSGAEWLNTAPVDEARKAEVARGLDGLLDSPATRDAALTSLKKWATKDNVPGLLKLVDDPDRGIAFRAMEVVGKLDDERAAPPLVKALAAFDRAGPARSALEALGKKAEKEVLKNLHNPNGQVRNQVRDLLRAWNVPDAAIFDQTLEDVNASDAQARVAALDDLVKRKRDEDRADKVAKAVDTALQDRELSVRRASVRVLGEWGTKDNVPGLLKLLDDRQMVGDVIPVLGKLKDPAAAAPLVKLLYDFGQRGRASKALQDIGKDVEGEALKELNSRDGGVRREVHNILRAVGTARSIPPLTQLIALNSPRVVVVGKRLRRVGGNPGIVNDCTQTIQAIQGRN